MDKLSGSEIRGGGLSKSVKRTLIQLTATLVLNGNLKGFAAGTIYSGKLKQVCVPGLNCHSCPGALGACPLGALQTMLADPGYKMSFYVLGLLTAFGVTAGRWICGWLCPFGFLQELLRVPVKKAIKLRKTPSAALPGSQAPFFLRYIKYVFLLLLVFLLPIFLTDKFGFGAPYYCELICPSGTIMGALPLFIANSSLRDFIGLLFYLKISVAAFIVLGSMVINRFFCKYLCPLGAIYGLFNSFALTRIVFCGDNCNGCGKCADVCSMDINPRKRGHRMECICCGKCVQSCGQGALRMETPKSIISNTRTDTL
jgi:polyferredoxin